MGDHCCDQYTKEVFQSFGHKTALFLQYSVWLSLDSLLSKGLYSGLKRYMNRSDCNSVFFTRILNEYSKMKNYLSHSKGGNRKYFDYDLDKILCLIFFLSNLHQFLLCNKKSHSSNVVLCYTIKKYSLASEMFSWGEFPLPVVCISCKHQPLIL